MFINLQKNYLVRFAPLRGYARDLRRALHLGRRDFNVCFVDDREIRRLNAAFRGKDRPTDVLSFPWEQESGILKSSNGAGSGMFAPRERKRPHPALAREFAGFLGDVVISVDTARHNARQEGHSTLNEIRWLILHGVLHLLGYDHARDRGRMTRLELKLREQLGVSDGGVMRRARKRASRRHG
jgi:probable rRNA maturation factor